MKGMIGRVLAQYGSPADLLREGAEAVQVKAFVEPVTEKSLRGIRAVEALGEVSLEKYVYIGPPEAALRDGDQVSCRGEDYVAVRAETLQLAGEDLYVWALLRKKGETFTWTS